MPTEKPSTKKDKSLKDKAIKIKGKDYVMVADRVKFFNEEYPNGAIRTMIISNEGGKIVVQASILPDCNESTRFFLAHSQEVEGQGMINKTSALENAETSAVGRALALMGIGVVDNIASADEVNKASNRASYTQPTNSQTGEVQELGNCAKCGAPNKLSQAGKVYCSALCWKKKPEEINVPPMTEEQKNDGIPF